MSQRTKLALPKSETSKKGFLGHLFGESLMIENKEEIFCTYFDRFPHTISRVAVDIKRR